MYNLESGIVDSATEIFFHNEPANQNTFYPSVNWDYEYHFLNILENGSYYCAIRACSNIEDPDSNITTIWSDYTKSKEILIKKLIPLTLEIDTKEWTDNIIPQITWEGVFVNEVEPMIIQYQINGGDWIDSDWIGLSGSGTFSSDEFSADGTYKIKIRGKMEEIDLETDEKIFCFGEESDEILYKRDANLPVIKITSPKTLDELENTIKISASIKDGGSGIDSWQLEYENNNNIGEWELFAFGKDELLSNSILTNWDISSLPLGVYTIRLTVVDNDENRSQSVVYVIVKIVSTSGPVPPTEVNVYLVTGTDASVQIYWNDEFNRQDVTYNVYRSADTNFENATLFATDIEETFYVDSDILYGKDYYYWVSAKTLDKGSELSESFAKIELDEMLGIEDYWTYCSFETPSGSGNINIANGNLVYNISDIICEDNIFKTVINRTYNSQSSYLSPLGYRWDFSYNICLFQEKDNYNNLLGMILKDGDGSYHYFEYDYSTGTYFSPSATFMCLEYDNKTGEHILRTKDNISYTFDDSLKLITIQNQNENTISFSYDLDDRLISIDNNKGESYTFSYYQQEDSEEHFFTEDDKHIGLLAQITRCTEESYIFTYKDGMPLLQTVIDKDSEYLKTYDYKEDTHSLVTAKGAGEVEVTVNYTKDDKTESLLLPDREKIEFEYIEDEVIVTDAHGEQTRYCYNADGCLSSIETSAGNKMTYIYNSNFQITNMKHEEYIDGNLEIKLDTFRYDEGTGELLDFLTPDAQEELFNDIR